MAQEYTQQLNEAYMRPSIQDITATPPVYQYWLKYDRYSSIHMDRGNLLFADGHVKGRKQSTICAHDSGEVCHLLPGATYSFYYRYDEN